MSVLLGDRFYPFAKTVLLLAPALLRTGARRIRNGIAVNPETCGYRDCAPRPIGVE